MYYVYILKWEDNHYIWHTNDLERRFQEHLRWETKTTGRMKNIKLLWYFLKGTRKEAIELEKNIKKDGHIQHWINHSTFIRNT